MKQLNYIVSLLILCGCASSQSYLERQGLGAYLSLPDERPEAVQELVMPGFGTAAGGDTTIVAEGSGGDPFVMKAVRDADSGEMIASDVIVPATVTARFRNVAERMGKINLEFQVTVPRQLLDSRWQVRLRPRLTLLGEEEDLEEIFITGERYRKGQLRGYQQYERFLEGLSADSLRFVFRHQLEVFLQRNLPGIYALKGDTTFVSDERFASLYGVTEQEAVRHYTNEFLIKRHRRRLGKKGEMFARFVKAPMQREGLRLDTVIRNGNGDLVYHYRQQIETRPRLKRADISLSGAVFEQEKRLCTLPDSHPLTFYISSLSAFVEDRERYLTTVVERQVKIDDACILEFETGRCEIDPDRGNNRAELGRIGENLRLLVQNRELEIDSIIITASASPEGEYGFNTRLSAGRGESVGQYLSAAVRSIGDSLARERGRIIDLTDGDWAGREAGAGHSAGAGFGAAAASRADSGDGREAGAGHSAGAGFGAATASRADSGDGTKAATGHKGAATPIPGAGPYRANIPFKVRSMAEDWDLLDSLVAADSALGEEFRRLYAETAAITEPDNREAALAAAPGYDYLREHLYPKLRRVKFDFHLHRRGMVADTILTTVPDTLYMRGVQAIKERDFNLATRLLQPYGDYNTALAYCATGRDASALALLEKMEPNAQVNYMMAMLYQRRGRDGDALRCYTLACSQNPTYIHRGNLDPEIASLIEKYRLFEKRADEQ